jgi:hypothetical protein
MISLWFLFFSPVTPPAVSVTVDPIGFDAIWVPPGMTGPIVAMPGLPGEAAFL